MKRHFIVSPANEDTVWVVCETTSRYSFLETYQLDKFVGLYATNSEEDARRYLKRNHGKTKVTVI